MPKMSVIVAFVMLCCTFAAPAPAQSPPATTFHSSSNLVLIPVVALKDGLPDRTLNREDFRTEDDGRGVFITSFEKGTDTRPLDLWFVVQCAMPGWVREGSGLFAGKTNLFGPVLDILSPDDRVAAAHWCDTGDSEIDLPPSPDTHKLFPALEKVLTAVPNPPRHGRQGELALERTLQSIVDSTSHSARERVPVVIFLYGDWSGMPKPEANHLVDELLETSTVVFGIRDRQSPHMWFLPGEQKEVAHYIATETGGQYLDVTANEYAAGLKRILDELHSRYKLGIKPEVLDGKRHRLDVRLTQEAKRTHKRTRLRYRAAYVAPHQAEP